MAVVYLHRKESDYSIYYVGIGNTEKRAYVKYGRNSHWERVCKKYGRIVDLVATDIDLEKAKELEIFLIQEIGVKNLCNKTLGGEGFFGGVHTEETKRKISKAFKGKKLSKETKRKISLATKGHPNYLKSQSKEARRKISEAMKGRIHSQETKDIISKKHKKNNHRPTIEALENAKKSKRKYAIKVKDLFNDLEFMVYESEKYTNVPKRLIYKNIKHNNPITKGEYKGHNFVIIH